MAVGFTPKHVEDFPLNDLTHQHFLLLALETAEKLGWRVSYVSKTGIIAYTNNGIFSFNAKIDLKIEDGIAHLTSSSTGNEMVDWGKNKKTINQFTAAFEEVKSTITAEDLELKQAELKDHFATQEEDLLQQPPATTGEKIKEFLLIFVPQKGYFITPILIDLNIVVFMIMALCGVNIFAPSGESLVHWGANFKPMTLDGQWWRLLTCCFLHIGIFHLLMNMYALLSIGILLEPIVGKLRFILAYLLSGLTASLVSLWWHDITVSAGASGAIFGMYGVFLALLTTNLIEENDRKNLMTSIAVFVGYNLLNGLKAGIDNAAHIGGLLGGIAIGYAFIPSLKQPENTRRAYSTAALLTILVVAISVFAYSKIPNDFATYEKKMAQFAENETKALAVYDMIQEVPKEELLTAIREKSIFHWQQNQKIMEEVDQLNLPENIRLRNTKLKTYCDLQIKSYEIFYKSVVVGRGGAIEEEIFNCNKQIDEILIELNNMK